MSIQHKVMQALRLLRLLSHWAPGSIWIHLDPSEVQRQLRQVQDLRESCLRVNDPEVEIAEHLGEAQTILGIPKIGKSHMIE